MITYIVFWNDDEEDRIHADDDEAGKIAAARMLKSRGLPPDTMFQLQRMRGPVGATSRVGGQNIWFRVGDCLETTIPQQQSQVP